MKKMDFYPSIEPFKTHMLEVSKIHKIYVEECGNPEGEPIIFLHGGPGAGCGKKARRFFDPEYYHIILFDQRGCGRSLPFVELRENTIFDLVEDIEKIRKYIGIEKFNIFSGSFGSMLALIYSLKYKARVKSLILQGVFLGRGEDINWFFEKGLSEIYVDEYEKFKNYIPVEEQNNLMEAYSKRFFSENEKIRNEAAKVWSDYELRVMESDMKVSEEIGKHDISLALLEAHYFMNKECWLEDNYILENVHKISDIPCYIAHGRFDFNARLSSSYQLSKIMKNCKLEIVEGVGHSPYTQKMTEVLIGFTEELKNGR